MFSFTTKLPLLVTVLSSLSLSVLAAVPAHPGGRLSPSEAELKYSRAHSLGDDYTFNVQDGWQTVNISDLLYKYEPPVSQTSYALDLGSALDSGAVRPGLAKRSLKKVGDAVKGAVKDIFKGLKAIGQAEAVTITWCVLRLPHPKHDAYY